jgi:hypothetical protein
MKAKEFRLGNYVNYGFIGNEKYLAEIIGLSKFGIESKVIDKYAPKFTTLQGHKNIKLIPLTEEWLLKFGFENNGNYWLKDYLRVWEWGICINITYHSQRLGSEDKSCFEIKHVHQLQNLYFALTGKELEIK